MLEPLSCLNNRMNGFLVLNFYRAGETEPATLEYLIRDYIGHMKHHLRQIFAEGFTPTSPAGERR